ncbi:hypothetical protein [Bradyrhizobium sp. HKCCYLR1051]|uniref:hypothetical protein n=1 Tax=Bradyrhizobium sp. HKCCYLR1051 TaxID=3420738 RepID=UPI003EC11C0A
MARQFSLPQNLKIVPLLAPTTTNGGVDSRRVNTAGFHKVWLVAEMKQAAGHATVVTLRQATAVTGGSNAAGPAATQNWLNEDAAAADALTKNANANAVTVTNNIKSKQVVFEVLPEDLTAGSPYVYLNFSDSSQATNFVSVTAYGHPRYTQATPPTAVT